MTSPSAPLTQRLLNIPPGLGLVEEAPLPTDQVQSLHQVGAAEVLVDSPVAAPGAGEGQEGQQGQRPDPQSHGRQVEA